MNDHIINLTKNMDLHPGASCESLGKVQESLGITFPDDYSEFLLYSNGAVGMIGKSYLDLWRLEELLTLNDGYRVKRHAPGIILIGSDGGGEGYSIDFRGEHLSYVKIPFITLDFDDIIYCGKSFFDFIDHLNAKI